MTARFCYILEYEAQELLRAQGYKVHILQKNNRKHALPLCVVAFREPGETRYVRLRKVSRKIPVLADVEACCAKEIALYRKVLARSPADPGLHCEIWIYAIKTGFHCYEVLQDSIREIPTPASAGADSLPVILKCPMLARGAP
jgi:hypothetical protein